MKCLLLLWENWAPASSVINYKLALKIVTFLALVNAKHCSDVPLLWIDNQYLFLQCDAAILISESGGKTN